MTRPAADCKAALLDRWLTAAINTARAVQSKTPRTVGLPANTERQTRIQIAETRRARATIAPATCICRHRLRSATNSARLKTP